MNDTERKTAEIISLGNSWILENGTLKAVIAFENGSVDMLSFYNRAAEKEYLTGSGERTLFDYSFGEYSVSAADGGWMLSQAECSEIELYGINWGKMLSITLSRETPLKMQVTMHFEIYNEDAGLRYQCFIQNREEREITIEKSDVLTLNFPEAPHTAHYVPNLIWTSTDGSLKEARNCVMEYKSGNGWVLSPEINWETHGAEGNPAFGGLDVWADGDKSVRFTTNPKALQLVLFPGEEMEYLAVNLTVFVGDGMDGRRRVERHFRKRYKFCHPETILCINDWEWYSGGKRTDAYYRNMVVPKALEMGADQIDVDDLWNITRDSTVPKEDFTDDLEALSEYIVSKGLRIGYWFSVTGGDHEDGRDLADWNNITCKMDQMENTLIGKYHSSWCQIDLTQLFVNPEVTDYSHPSDSVYRKNVNMRKYMNYITHKYPHFIMKPTNEVDNGQGRIPLTRNNGLIHLADNGILCAHGEFETRDISPWVAFHCFGYFPMLSNFGYFCERYEQSAAWLYQLLLSRETALYRPLEKMDDGVVMLMRKFNDWRKEEPVRTLLGEGVLPVCAGDPWVWMNVSANAAEALLFAVSEEKEGETAIRVPLRWLDGKKSYRIRDISLNDRGEFSDRELGVFQGEKLKEGFSVEFAPDTSRAKAYWLREE